MFSRLLNKCSFAWASKKTSPYFISVLGGATVKELFSGWNENASDVIMTLNGSKEFQNITPDAQSFLVSIISIVFAVAAYILVGRIFYKRWNCWRRYEKKGGHAA